MKWWRSTKEGIRNIKDFRIGRRVERGNAQQVQGIRTSGPIYQIVLYIKDHRLGSQCYISHVPSTSTQHVRGYGQPWDSTKGFDHENQGDFSLDYFAHHLPDEYYDGVGPKRLKLVVRFLVGPDGHLRCVLHGLWPEPRNILSIAQLKDHAFKLRGEEVKFDDLFQNYGHLILARWPDLNDPTSLEAAKTFFTKQWNKHGKPAGMSRLMYLYHGLALMSAIPENFDIPVGVPMTMDELGRRVQAVVRDLHIFGDHIGADVMPEIVAGMDPNTTGQFQLKEIRILLERTVKEGRAVCRVLPVDGGKCFTGKANSGSNIVILPLTSSSSS